MGRLILSERTVGEIEEKKSRFIATMEPVHSEEEASAFFAAMRKQYWDAKHNCTAFIIGEDGMLVRCSDDREPSGTAGRPMLEVLQKSGLTDVAVVVTRYFGGVLLGTGGLVRAYQGAVKAALEEAEHLHRILEEREGVVIRYQTDYSYVTPVTRLLREEEIPEPETEYEATVVYSFFVGTEKEQDILCKLTELTLGTGKVLSRELTKRVI